MALNKPFTASLSRGTKQPCWRGRDALEWDKQSKLPFHMGHFPYSPKTFENLETKAMVQKFPGKDSRNSGKCWISEMRTIQPKILEILGAKLNGKKTSGETFSKIWVLLARFSSFLEILENALFLSLLEVAMNSNQTFWLNGKRPTMYMYPWLFCTMTNCKGPINSYQLMQFNFVNSWTLVCWLHFGNN